jgi:chromosome segregation protein
VSAPARLLALRLQGFKSFADRTIVEFGPGISAVVGPNGSGKSNLADALRWTLGEQGRALRSRRSEDVIFAGSERRSALGMADVTLVLDNADGLLPVEYTVLELERRLYRSGENDYMLNRQRVRLRDLVDLLDGANLADNAFLFIGQGMVDQALALRPEERRPLFEEAAGVRRHERRRRKAEDQLTESEANLARVEDILAELRPQARRLGAQAEQQASRASAGRELGEALVLAAHARWFEAAGRVAESARRRTAGVADADRAMVELQAAEEAAAAVAADLGNRSIQEQERRGAHDAAREALTVLRLDEARLAGDLEAISRDRIRLADERAAAEADLAVQRRMLAQPVPARDLDLEAAATDAERSLAEALAELGVLRASSRARGEELAALRRAEAARQAETETARRRLLDAERRAQAERERASELEARRAELEITHAAAADSLRRASEAEAGAAAAREAARATADAAEAAAADASRQAAASASGLAALRGRLDSLRARLQEEEARGIAAAARRRGGRRVDEDLAVDPTLRAAVEAALAETARAYVVGVEAVPALVAERGTLVVGPFDQSAPDADRAVRRFRDRLDAVGGGLLADAVRRDPAGAVRHLLQRSAWAPDIAACLACRDDLPPGWAIVTRDGTAVVSGSVVSLGKADSPLERRDEIQRLDAEVTRVAAEAQRLSAAATETARAATVARAGLESAGRDVTRIAADQRRAADEERIAARALEGVLREAAWHEAQAERIEAEAGRLRAAAVSAQPIPGEAAAGDQDGDAPDEEAIGAWEARTVELRTRRDRLTADLAAQDAVRRDAEGRRAQAAASAAMDEERIARADRSRVELDDREQMTRLEIDALRSRLAAAAVTEARCRTALDELHQADAADRLRLAAAEQAALAARERLRAADDRLRAADRAELESRLNLDAVREQLLVELAGLGGLGLAVLGGLPDQAEAGMPDRADAEEEERTLGLEAAALEAALDRASVAWASGPPGTIPPAPGRIAWLRRRYHDLGAANPFAADEYEALKRRLETLEGQQGDLRQAMSRTRELIEELNAMIAEQFRTTFRALEVAFDQRFQQLFGGGFARLSLTDPGDLSVTGVEIVARPPGKRAQPLAMLSGGERSLTAVALLFAMLEVRPVPFCVLDEVDAALDEANVGRFAEALRSLADRTQFIVITHNRGTIEAADALYGVTVGDDSASRVVSLRLDEAQAIAERRNGSGMVGTPAG